MMPFLHPFIVNGIRIFWFGLKGVSTYLVGNTIRNVGNELYDTWYGNTPPNSEVKDILAFLTVSILKSKPYHTIGPFGPPDKHISFIEVNELNLFLNLVVANLDLVVVNRPSSNVELLKEVLKKIQDERNL